MYLADFAPSNLNGGSIILSRLLEDYPQSDMVMVTGSAYAKLSPRHARFACEHFIFPITNNTGPWGIGKLKMVLNIISMPVLFLFALWVFMRRRAKIIFSVVHGHFFLVGFFLSLVTRSKLIVCVHDDWVALQSRPRAILEPVYSAIFRFVLTHAAHIYCIGLSMQQHLKRKYCVESELQFPARQAFTSFPADTFNANEPRIVYAGNVEEYMSDCLAVLAAMCKADLLKRNHGISSVCISIYSNMSTDMIARLGLVDPRISIHGWLPQEDLAKELQKADILFLPFSFEESQKAIVSTSLPTKIADYLASARPMLVFGPPYASITQYARDYGFAEIVQEHSPVALAKGIYAIVSSASYREQLKKNALRIFEENHNIIKQRRAFTNLISSLK